MKVYKVFVMLAFLQWVSTKESNYSLTQYNPTHSPC